MVVAVGRGLGLGPFARPPALVVRANPVTMRVSPLAIAGGRAKLRKARPMAAGGCARPRPYLRRPMQQESLAVRDPRVENHNPPHQVPLVAASSFVFGSIEEGVGIFDGQRPGHIYGRFGNPTIDAAAAKIAALEAHGLPEERGGAHGLFCASGMAAISTAILAACPPGGTVLTSADLYGGTTGLLQQLAERGIQCITADLRDPDAVDAATGGGTAIDVIYAETPANPTLRCTDLRYLAAAADLKSARLIVDNTFATPVAQQPLLHGADVVVHSTTKYLNGHGTGVAGAIVTTDKELFRERIVPTYRLFGGSGNPWDAWLVLNGLKTLPLRMRAHSTNARAVAEYLAAHRRVTAVNYPGLPGHPDAEIISQQLRLPGGMLSFELDGGLAAAERFMNAVEFCTLTPTLGDVDTLILHPATMSHRGLDPAVRRAHGIADGLVRVSVGIEAVEDILADIERAIG